MDTDRTVLNNADRQKLAELAERTGDAAVRDTVYAYLEQGESNGLAQPGFEEDTECLAYCMEELRAIEEKFGPEAHRILSKVQGSIVDVLNEDRGER